MINAVFLSMLPLILVRLRPLCLTVGRFCVKCSLVLRCCDLGLQELLCRSALETQKLDLMTEISTLKLKLGAMEKDRLDFDEQFRDGEV